VATKYFGVIGNRDYIKYHGEKRPFWEFLDVQPDGWLTSLVYHRKDLPTGRPMIFDCGAWSYRLDDEPDIDAQSAFDQYVTTAPAGSMLIAPDHMLIEGVDLDWRREWNMKQAIDFLHCCSGSGYIPMATVHGMDLAERQKNAWDLMDIGYRHIAMGGLAARASQRSLVVEWVQRVRDVIPGVYLHVLGLTSPNYMRMWNEIGVDSADGSSHFKQAFTAGAFFAQADDKLTKHQAARTGEAITAPECDCTACRMLREDGIDTRTYGSNETNMGRAAHNLNMLMRAQKCALSTSSLV
jgi:hypothetical protein